MNIFTISLQNSSSPYSRSMVALMLFYSLIATSPIFLVVGLHGRHLLTFVIFGILLASFCNSRKLKKWLLFVAAVLFIPAVIPALYWNDLRFVLLPMFLFVPCMLLAQSTAIELSKYVDWASWFLFALLLGACIGYFLAQNGVAPLGVFPNPDGRPNYFFYTTLTNVYVDNYIRPSGIYDEPGALSFFVCAVVFARYKCRKAAGLTWMLLGLGFITFSLMHLIFTFLFLVSRIRITKKVLKVGLAIALVLIVLPQTELSTTIGNNLFSRLSIEEGGTIAGDNRSALMRNAAETLKYVDHAWVVGVDADCTFNRTACLKKWGAIIVNPLDPLVTQGIFLSWPYYILIGLSVLLILKGRGHLPFFAVGLLFAQRPYLLMLSYSFMAIFVLWLQISSGNFRALKYRFNTNINLIND